MKNAPVFTLFRRRLKNTRNVRSALTSVYGINTTFANYSIRALGFSPNAKLKDVPLASWKVATQFIDKNFAIDRQLTRRDLTAISEHVRNGSYKGIRFIQGLPVHGQRTHSNARTARRMFRGKFVKPVKVKGSARQPSKKNKKK